MSTETEAFRQVVTDAVGTGRTIVVDDLGTEMVTGRIEAADQHGFAIFGTTPSYPNPTGRYLLWRNLLHATDPMNPTPERCDFCGRDDVEFEDGLRCKLCAEEQDANDDDTEAADATA